MKPWFNPGYYTNTSVAWGAAHKMCPPEGWILLPGDLQTGQRLGACPQISITPRWDWNKPHTIQHKGRLGSLWRGPLQDSDTFYLVRALYCRPPFYKDDPFLLPLQSFSFGSAEFPLASCDLFHTLCPSAYFSGHGPADVPWLYNTKKTYQLWKAIDSSNWVT